MSGSLSNTKPEITAAVRAEACGYGNTQDVLSHPCSHVTNCPAPVRCRTVQFEDLNSDGTMRKNCIFIAVLLTASLVEAARSEECSGQEFLRLAGTWGDGRFSALTLYQHRLYYYYPEGGGVCLPYSGTIERFSFALPIDSTSSVIQGIATYARYNDNLWTMRLRHRSVDKTGTIDLGRAARY